MAIRNGRRNDDVCAGAANENFPKEGSRNSKSASSGSANVVERRHLRNLDRLLWPMTNQFPAECTEAWFAACDARWRMRIAELMREIEAENAGKVAAE